MIHQLLSAHRTLDVTYSAGSMVLWIIGGMLSLYQVLRWSRDVGGLLEVGRSGIEIPPFVTKRGEFCEDLL